MELGFIGLGQMGRPMAARLLGAGHALKAYNRTRMSGESLERGGAILVERPCDTMDAEIIVTMLADDAAVRSVWLDSGLAAAMPRGALHLNMATTSLALARELAAAHARGDSQYVAAPVFGRPPVAAQGQLDVIAAGPAAAIERCQQLFRVLAKQVFVVGEHAYKANAVKIARNFLLATLIESLGEATALARKAGIGADVFINIITSTSFNSPAYRNYGKMIVDKSFEPAQFAMTLGLKDVELALHTARDLGASLPTAELISKQLKAAIASGRGGRTGQRSPSTSRTTRGFSGGLHA